MTALNPAQQAQLNISIRNATGLSRLASVEVDAVFAAMTSNGHPIQAPGTGGNITNDQATLNSIAVAVSSDSALERLCLTEAIAALSWLQGAGYGI
jgi:hypothetical protein